MPNNLHQRAAELHEQEETPTRSTLDSCATPAMKM
jgi:hypothetical protein